MKLVREYINETYESGQELFKVAHILLRKLNSNELKLIHFYNILDFLNPEKFQNIKNFLKSGVGISFFIFKGSNLRYFKPSGREDDPPPGQYLSVDAYDKHLPSPPEKKEEYKKKFPGGFIMMFVKNPGILVHELQHAYDDYRSKNLIHLGKQESKFSDTNYKNQEDKLRAYFRQPTELSAYFTQTIHNINFRYKGIMKPFNDIQKEFFKKIRQLDYFMTPKNKKIYLRKLAQYYYKIKEKYEK